MTISFLTKEQNIIAEVEGFIEEWNSESDFVMVKTSGSTGIPKEIKLSKNHMIASAKMTGDFLKLNKNDRALLCLSPSTIAGKMMIVRSIVLEMKLSVGDVSSNPLNGTSESFDFIAMVPLQIQNSIKQELDALCNVKTIIVGGGIVSEELNRKIQELPCNVMHTFGMTETISHIAMRNLSKGENNYNALPNVSFELHNDCLTINAPDLGVNSLKTNDVVELTSPTSFVWKGRNDFVINSGGVKIHPEEVEKAIENIIEHPFFISGLNDPKLGSKVVLCVESKLDSNISRKTFSDVLTAYQTPKEIYFLDEFIRTKSDKINRLETIKLISDVKKQVL